MNSTVDFSESFDELNTVYPVTIAVGAKAEESPGVPSTIDDLLESYKDKEPGAFKIGGTFGFDSSVFRLELSSATVSVVDVEDEKGVKAGKLLVIQGMVFFRIAQIISISAAVIGAYDTDCLADPLELFNRDLDPDEKAEAARTRNSFYTDLGGNVIRSYEFIKDGRETNGLYFLYDANDKVKDKQYVFTATGLMDFSWLEKIGVNCALKIGAIGAYNSFEDAWEVGLGAKITIPSGTDYMAVGRIGFKGGKLNTLAFEVRGEIPIGPVLFTQIKFGVSGMAESVSTYSPGLGVAFGPEINIDALSSKFTKMIGLKVGKFRVVEVGAFGEIASDFQNVSLSIEGKLFGLLEIKGGWKRVDGNYNEISLSVGTRQSSTFNFQISGSVGWSRDQLTVKGSLDGSFKWDFTALGITWIGINVGGGVSIVYNQISSRKTLSIAVSGRAQVKVTFIKIGIDVSNSWFLDLSSRDLAHTCTNTRLESASSGRRMLKAAVKTDDEPEDIQGEKIGSYSWTSSELAEEGRTYITLAVQHSLTDVEWVLYGADGSVHSSTEPDESVRVKRVSYSQLELTVDNAVRGEWTLDVYGSRNRNGEVYIYAEAGDPVETDVRVVSVDKKTVTVEYQAHATGDSYLAALYMERADQPEDQHEGMILDYLTATEGDEYNKVTIDLPEDVQGGMYRFYVMAQSTNCAEVAYSAKTEEVKIQIRTASLKVTDCRVEFQAADLRKATVFCTVSNPGSEASGEFMVELLLGESEMGTDDDQVVSFTKTSLDAGESREIRLAADIPQEYIGKLAALSVRLDLANVVDEGIFEGDNIVSKTIAPAVLAAGHGKVLSWAAVEGASSYDLEYAVEEDWNDGAVLRGITGNSIELDLAAGHYSFRVTPCDAEGKAIAPGVAWDDSVIFFSSFMLSLDVGSDSVSSEQFSLLDGLYDWEKTDFGSFTGTLALYQVDGIRRGHDEQKMIVEVVNGEISPGSETVDLLLDNGLYYFTAAGSGTSETASELSFSISGDVFPNMEPERNIVSLPDCVDEKGHYSECLEGWGGPFSEPDVWNYLLEDAGELSLSVDAPESLTGSLIVELFVQDSANGRYQRAGTFSVDASASAESLLDRFIVTNNFYVRVGVRDNGTGEDFSDYSLNLDFAAFDDSPLDDGAWSISAGKEPVRVDGWVGYRKDSDTYLLDVDDDCAGQYEFNLTGDAGEATLNIRSISGKLLRSAALSGQGTAVIPDFNLYSGDYLVEIDSRNDIFADNNTKYSLTVSQTRAFEVISETNFAEVESAGQGEKLFFALDVPESGLYDLSELWNAGLTVWIQDTDLNGALGTAKLRPDWAKLEWDVPSYLTVCNFNSAWGDARIGLDAENRKFVLLAATGQ